MYNQQYSQAELIRILHAYANEIGETPNTLDIMAIGGPTVGTFRRNFRVKTWDEVIELAGLPPVFRHTPPDKRMRLDTISKEDVILAFSMFIREYGYLPMVNEYPDLYAASRKVFKDDRRIVEACGFDYDELKRATDIERRRRRDLPMEEHVYDTIQRTTGYSREFTEKFIRGDFNIND